MSSKPDSKYIGVSFSFKLGVWYSIFFLICVVTLFVFSFHLLQAAVFQKDAEVLDLQANKYTESYNKGGLVLLRRKFDEERMSARDVFFLRVLTHVGRISLVRTPPGTETPDAKEIENIAPQHSGRWYSPDRKNVWTIKSVKLRDGNILQVGKNSIESMAFLRSLRDIFIKTAIPVLLLGIFVGIALTYRAIKPIRNIILAVRNILQTGEIKTRVTVEAGTGELHELVTIVNQMLNRNQEIFDAMRNSLDNVAHDLRTPMTRLRGSAESALLSDDNEKVRDAMADCLEESDQVLQMLNIMMDVAEVESGAMKLNIEKIDLCLLLEKVVDLYEIVAEDRSIRILSDFRGELVIEGDKTRLKQVFANLIDNAIKYSSEDSTIWIVGEKDGDYVTISVQDQGIGISGQDKIRIFNRLYRADSSRSKRGLGLGLSLVKGVVEAHNGRIVVESAGENKGSSFNLTLPIKRIEASDS